MYSSFLKGNRSIGSSSEAQKATPWQELFQGHLPAHHNAHTQDFSPGILQLCICILSHMVLLLGQDSYHKLLGYTFLHFKATHPQESTW